MFEKTILREKEDSNLGLTIRLNTKMDWIVFERKIVIILRECPSTREKV